MKRFALFLAFVALSSGAFWASNANAGVPPGCEIISVGVGDAGYIQGSVQVRCTKHYDITYEFHEQVYGTFWFETAASTPASPAFGSPGNSNNTYTAALPYSGCAHYRMRVRTWISTDSGTTTYTQDSFSPDLPWAPIYHAGCA